MKASFTIPALIGVALLTCPCGGWRGLEASSARLTVLVSDLHLGLGKDPSTGDWHSFEDFRWPDELSAFLTAIDRRGGGATDLIVNGDTFELWQAVSGGCVHANARLGCTEAEAVERVRHVVTEHAQELTDLGAFASTGTNQLVLVPGDHDAALSYPSVARVVLDAIPAPPGRVEIVTAGYWLSLDGLIYAEHGQQIGNSANRFARWPGPFLAGQGDTAHLERTWGERAVQSLYDRLEVTYPVVDNVAQEGLGLKYVLREEASAVGSQGLGPLLRLFLFKMPWHQLRTNLEAQVQPVDWDVEQIRRQGQTFLVESLPGDDPFRELVQEAAVSADFGLRIADLTDSEVAAICDYRAALRRARRRMEQGLTQLPRIGPAVRQCPRLSTTVGPTYQYYWTSRDAVFNARFDEVVVDLRFAGVTERPVVFVYSHTHLSHTGFSPVAGSSTPTFVNTGAWQRTIYPAHLQELERASGAPRGDFLRSLRPEDLAPCYSFVWVEPYDDTPRATLRYWRRGDDGQWTVEPPARGGICPR